MRGALWGTLCAGFHRAALPLVSYYAITLGVPLANGASLLDAAFVKHAATVAVVPPIAIVLPCAAHSTLRSLIARTYRKTTRQFQSRASHRRGIGMRSHT